MIIYFYFIKLSSRSFIFLSKENFVCFLIFHFSVQIDEYYLEHMNWLLILLKLYDEYYYCFWIYFQKNVLILFKFNILIILVNMHHRTRKCFVEDTSALLLWCIKNYYCLKEIDLSNHSFLFWKGFSFLLNTWMFFPDKFYIIDFFKYINNISIINHHCIPFFSCNFSAFISFFYMFISPFSGANVWFFEHIFMTDMSICEVHEHFFCRKNLRSIQLLSRQYKQH